MLSIVSIIKSNRSPVRISRSLSRHNPNTTNLISQLYGDLLTMAKREGVTIKFGDKFVSSGLDLSHCSERFINEVSYLPTLKVKKRGSLFNQIKDVLTHNRVNELIDKVGKVDQPKTWGDSIRYNVEAADRLAVAVRNGIPFKEVERKIASPTDVILEWVRQGINNSKR
jgi:hypothetical protein